MKTTVKLNPSLIGIIGMLALVGFMTALYYHDSMWAIFFGFFIFLIPIVVSAIQSSNKWWPFVHKSEFEQMRQERNFMKEALRDANAELFKHRQLIAGLRAGRADVTEALERIFTKGE